VLDPVSKQLIIDEVELFQVEKSEIGFSGKFIGTDYDFCNSLELRAIIFTNCLDSERDEKLKFKHFKLPSKRIL
jgi:hypothetical protein